MLPRSPCFPETKGEGTDKFGKQSWLLWQWIMLIMYWTSQIHSLFASKCLWSHGSHFLLIQKTFEIKMTRQKIMIDYDRVDRTQSLLRYPLPTGLQLNAIFFDFCDHLFSMQQNSDASSAQMKMMLPTKNTAAEIMLNAPGIFEAAPDFRDIYTSSFCSQSYSIQNSIHDCTIHSSR